MHDAVRGRVAVKYLPMRPEGRVGRIFGAVMERLNRPAYAAAVRLLDPLPHECFLEVGFGTGALVERLLSAGPTIRVAGVDPTPTMLAVASRRRGVASESERTDLRTGSDVPLPWPDGHFSGAAALHSFQFWPEPADALRELGRVLRPGGRLVLVLRDHSRRPPQWLPNPVSRSGREVERAVELLEEVGFAARREGPVGSSAVLFATTGSGAA